MTPEISLISGTWNRIEMLRAMLDTFRTSVGPISHEIILVDGNSTDGTLEYLEAQPDVTLIRHTELRGVIAAFMDGIAVATGRYVILGNDDITWGGDSVQRAYQFMLDNPDVGMGLFMNNRNRGNRFDNDPMPAHFPDGTMTNVPYTGLTITPRWLGDKLGWLTLPGARSYGADCAMIARCLEAGWPVSPIPGTQVSEPFTEVNRPLQQINSMPVNDANPDTQAYLKLWPRGPELGRPRAFSAPPDMRGPLKILYCPIYESNSVVQHEQKYGLRQALQRFGRVWEIDYMTPRIGVQTILSVAQQWQPDIVFIQAHYPEPFTPGHAKRLREILPNAKLVCWSGDVYNIAANEKYGEDYLAMLRYFNLQLVVNVSALATYEAARVRAYYWQNAYEPAGVGHAPDDKTPRHDVVFLGTMYNVERRALGEALKSLPYNVGLYGGEWPKNWQEGYNLYDFVIGCQLYRNARLTVSIAETREPSSAFVSNRLFQACAAGNCLVLQQYVEGLEKWLGYVDGEHYVVWHDLDELQSLIDYWMQPEQDERRLKIARAGQAFTLKRHSFTERVDSLFSMLDNPQNVPFGVRPSLIGPEFA